MKKLILICLSAFLMTSTASAQVEDPKDAKLKAHILELDKAAWDAWMQKDVATFRAGTRESFLSVGSEGITNKQEMMDIVFVDCDLRSYKLYDVRLLKLNKKAVILTYTATQEGDCDGSPLPPKVLATVTYVKEDGKWMEAIYMETAVE